MANLRPNAKVRYQRPTKDTNPCATVKLILWMYILGDGNFEKCGCLSSLVKIHNK